MQRVFVAIAAWAILLSGTSEAQNPLSSFSLTVEETGPDNNPNFAVRFERFLSLSRPGRITSPAGEVFEVADVGVIPGATLRDFSSLTEAYRFLEGTWQVELADPNPAFTFIPNDTQTEFEFSIGDLSSAPVIRERPTLLSPTPSQSIRNGETFLLAFDYEGDGEAPSTATLETFQPETGLITRLLPEPVIDSPFQISGGVGVGDRFLGSELASVPDTEDFRFLYTLTSTGAPLPLDVQVTLGGPISDLSDALTLGDVSNVFGGVSVGLTYSRLNDPFTITLVGVPEPATLGMLVMALILPLAGHRHLNSH